MFSNEGFCDGLWFMNLMTAEDLQQQKLRDLLVELPTTPARFAEVPVAGKFEPKLSTFSSIGL